MVAGSECSSPDAVGSPDAGHLSQQWTQGGWSAKVGRYTAHADKKRAGVVVKVHHLGDRVTSGHYLTLLGKPKGSGWEYVVCDDNRPSRRAKKADLDLVDSNCYLLGLVRCP